MWQPRKNISFFIGLVLVMGAIFVPAFGSTAGEGTSLGFSATGHGLAIACLVIFIIAYGAVMAEEILHLNKSKPVLLAAGIIWILIAIIARQQGVSHEAMHRVVEHNLGEYAAILLFLLVAMTYINALAERNVFAALKTWLSGRNFTLRQLFWITGILSFFISPFADNLTTAMIMGSVIMVIGEKYPRFVVPAMINIVIAANAGGAFSPFGDITTLMVWQAGKIDFFRFFELFVPSAVNFLVPAIVMSFFVPGIIPEAKESERVAVKPGGFMIIFLFIVTIVFAVIFEQAFSLPAFMGMMSGLALLMFYVYYLGRNQKKNRLANGEICDVLDIFKKIAMAEWDTLLFFFGVIFSVGGLACLGYLSEVSTLMYGQWGATIANIASGLISAVVDNIPVMFAILNMNPDMGDSQWLLITLTAGVGGSLLSIGSAAGVALMGVSRGHYSFMKHLRWSWVILLGYFLSVGTHLLMSGID